MQFHYKKLDSTFLETISNFKKLNEIYNYLLMSLGGEVKKALELLENLQSGGYIDSNLNLEDFKKRLLEKGLVNFDSKGSLKMSFKGEKNLREKAFNEIFQKMAKSRDDGEHQNPFAKKEVEDLLPEKKKYAFGDDFDSVDVTASLLNTIKRDVNFDLSLKEEDLEVYQKETGSSCATALLIDISHSMILYGEDRITPAKQVALAFVHLVLSKYPKDDLTVIVFGDDAKEISISEIPYISVGPYHTNTQMALKVAREVLVKKKQKNKQILMITDGKPTMLKVAEGKYYKNSFGLDPMIVSKTLDEAILCRKRKISITNFMIAQDSELKDFIKKLSEVNRGKAFYSSVDNLGRFMIENFVSNRKKQI